MKNNFHGKNIMIIVPHQDDELNICGGMFTSNYFDMDKVKIVFSTNGDYFCNYKARVRETYRIAKKLGIKKENIIFMGYSDQFIVENNHIYLTHQPNILKSKKGNDETFGDNYHFSKYNKQSKFNHENFVNDLIDIISDNRPDVIFTIDFDSHPDHRALSLSFEESIGIILKKDMNFKPVIYKAFAYPTYYKGIKDFNNKVLENTKFLTEPHSLCEMQNPYYDWNERISFKVKNNRLLLFNKTYKLFRIYRSQLIIKKIYSIINNDLVFFKRRTDNLLLNSSIEVSSGNKEYLNDFMLFDVSSITKGDTKKPELNNSYFIFDSKDKKREIKIKLDKKHDIKEMVLYRNFDKSNKPYEIELLFDDNTVIKKKLFDNKSIIKLDKNSKNITIRVNSPNIGFSEIELFDSPNINEIINEKIINNVHIKIIIVLIIVNYLFNIFFVKVILITYHFQFRFPYICFKFFMFAVGHLLHNIAKCISAISVFHSVKYIFCKPSFYIVKVFINTAYISRI